MEFTQQQVRELVGIEEGTFVYWAKMMPRVRSLKGKGRRFKLSDVLALAVLATAVHELGCAVGHLAPSVETVFDICHGMSFDEASNKFLLFKSGHCEIRSTMPSIDREIGSGAVIVRFAPLVERITSRLESDQYRLPL
jgi:hypothetical protein